MPAIQSEYHSDHIVFRAYPEKFQTSPGFWKADGAPESIVEAGAPVVKDVTVIGTR